MRVPVVVSIVIVVVWSSAGNAAAHSDEGELRLSALRPTDVDHEVELVVDLAYEDGHAVYRGDVMLAGGSDTGVSLLPVAVAATTVDGRYVARVELPPPGTWTLRVTSREPAAELEVVFDTSSPDYVEEDAEPLPVAPDHGVPWRWVLAGMAGIAVVALVATRQRRRS